jgi:hypothetical protein
VRIGHGGSFTRDHPDVLPQPQYRQAQANQAQRALVGIAPMIAKTFFIVKDFYTYAIRNLRQEKILRDHGCAGPPDVIRFHASMLMHHKPLGLGYAV